MINQPDMTPGGRRAVAVSTLLAVVVVVWVAFNPPPVPISRNMGQPGESLSPTTRVANITAGPGVVLSLGDGPVGLHRLPSFACDTAAPVTAEGRRSRDEISAI